MLRGTAISVLMLAAAAVMGTWGPPVVIAGEADVVKVEVRRAADGAFGFDVTVRHADTGWQHYADKWDVVAPDGSVLATRVLLHPHETEQPFTRSLDGVSIPADVGEVTIRAHDNVDGYGGKEIKVALPR